MGLLFADKVAWITGASAGIGREMALEFARQGATVAVSARRKERLDEVVAQIEKEGGRGLAVPCDVTQEDQIESAVAQVVAELGRLDVAVANAGFGVSGRIEDLTAEDWRRQFDTNVVGAAITARHAIGPLRKTGGRLALICSVAGFIASPKTGAYAASKYALRAIGQTLAIELHGSGVSCSLIHPGFVESEIAQIDNNGVFRPDWQDKRPAKLMWPTDKAARVIVKAVHRRRREYVFTMHGKALAWLGRSMPGLAHFAQTRGVKTNKETRKK